MKTFEQIYESNPYRNKDKWNTQNLTRWYSGDKPVGKRAEDMKDFIEKEFKGLQRENRSSMHDNVEEVFVMVDKDGEQKYRVELINKGDVYELYVDKPGKYGNTFWKTDEAEHAGAMMEYLFGNL